jgi:hypothetical protein
MLLRAIRTGYLVPDARAGRLLLFRPDKLAYIAASVAAFLTPRQADKLNQVLNAAESAESARLRAVILQKPISGSIGENLRGSTRVATP